MKLAKYIEAHGTAAKRDLARKTGLRWATIHDIAAGKATPRAETAKKIEAATGGVVTAAELLGIESSEAA